MPQIQVFKLGHFNISDNQVIFSKLPQLNFVAPSKSDETGGVLKNMPEPLRKVSKNLLDAPALGKS